MCSARFRAHGSAVFILSRIKTRVCRYSFILFLSVRKAFLMKRSSSSRTAEWRYLHTLIRTVNNIITRPRGSKAFRVGAPSSVGERFCFLNFLFFLTDVLTTTSLTQHNPVRIDGGHPPPFVRTGLFEITDVGVSAYPSEFDLETSREFRRIYSHPTSPAHVGPSVKVRAAHGKRKRSANRKGSLF